MQLLPMDLPAEIHRRIEGGARCGTEAGDVVVAKGPLVIMAHGLLAIDPADRGGFWISSAMGDLDSDQAEAALREWNRAREE